MNGRKVIIAVAVCSIAAALIAVLLAFTFKKAPVETPEKAFTAFISELNQDDINGMLEYVEPSEAELIRSAMDKLGGMINSNALKVMVKWMPFLSIVTQEEPLPDLHPEIVTVKEDGDTAVITICLKDDGSPAYYDVYMIKIEEKWYIRYAWKSDFPAEGETA